MPEVDSNTPNTETPPNTNPDPKAEEHRKEIERITAENADMRKKSKEAADRATAAETEVANLKKAGAKGAGDWQKMAELAEAEVTLWKNKAETQGKAFVNTLTSAKIREEALKAGLVPEFVDLLDSMDFAEVEAVIDENNRFNVKGTETAIKNLKTLRPKMFETKQAPQFNKGGTGSVPEAKDLASAKANFEAAIPKRFKDPAAYNKAHSDYQNAINEARKGKH